MKWFMEAGLLVFLLAQTVMAGESGSVLKAEELRSEPYRDAKVVGKLAVGDRVEIVKREGGWLLLSKPSKGWVRMLSVRKGAVGSAPGAKPSGVVALATGRAGTGKVVSSTGVRGLNEEELQKARFDEKEVQLVESYTVSKEEGVRFAAKAKLKARQVDYLSE
ncbi:MAG: SH3 domain-containing protein [Desulfobulbaceae bacterium]|nr:SH3 domain-containing protein [Desulfobulbaceae bacterium]